MPVGLIVAIVYSMGKMCRGVTVGGILLGVMVIALLGFTLAAVGTMHLNLSNRSNSATSASNLARSAASLGIAKILENQEFGKDRAAGTTVEVVTELGKGVLTFNQAESETAPPEVREIRYPRAVYTSWHAVNPAG